MRFRDVTAAAGLDFHHEAGAGTSHKWYPETMGSGAGFLDYDGDGHTDILLVNGRQWPGERQSPEPTMRLYRNAGDGSFRDVTAQSGLAAPLYGMGMTAADYDNDGDPDLVVTGYRETRLFRNDQGRFADISATAGLVQGDWSTAAAFVDVDRDGWLDLLIGQYVVWTPEMEADLDCTYGTPQKDYCAVTYFQGQGLRLYRNLGDGTLREMTAEAGMAAPEARVLGLNVMDHNHDGWQDLLMVNGHVVNEERLRNVPYAQRPQLFRNMGNGTFTEVAPASETGLDIRLIGRGAAYADYDRDGDLDLLLTANQGRAYLMRNETGRAGSFVRVLARGTQSNRDGIGARVQFYGTARHGNGKRRSCGRGGAIYRIASWP